MPRVPPVTSAAPRQARDSGALLERHDARAPHEAGAEGGQADGRARVQAAVALGLGQRERDRGGATCSPPGRRRRRPILGHAELERGRLDDPRVGLVGDEQVEVVDGQAGARRSASRVASTIRATAWR